MVRFFSNLKHVLPFKKTEKVAGAGDTETSLPGTGINARIENIYGQEKITLQKLYEKWTVRDAWLIRYEGIPLILGYDPESRDADLPVQAADELWIHAQKCVEKGLLHVNNIEQTPDLWTSSPVEIYKWATVSRIELPELFNNLMSFIVNTLQSNRGGSDITRDETGRVNSQPGNSRNHGETVLGIAFALLAANPEKFRDENGNLQPEQIVALIKKKHEFWTGEEKLDLSTDEIADILTRWLATVRIS